MSEPLEAWVERQFTHAAAGLLRSVSPVAIVKTRPGFEQTIHPVKGAIVASPVLASYDPEPDYFFHWYRDSALVMDALRLLFEDGDHARLADFADFVRFSLALHRLDGRALVSAPAWRGRVRAEFARFLRSDGELEAARGQRISGETRVNPDGTLDITSWPRPQHDGAALRALTVLRWLASPLEAPVHEQACELLELDLAYVRRFWPTPCYDIWEEEKGLHYYTLRVSAAALEAAAAWNAARGELAQSQRCRAETDAIGERLDEYWLEEPGYYRSRVLDSGARSAKELDISVILAVVHAAAGYGRHTVQDPRIHSTLHHLERLFESEYAINRGRKPGRAPALGRYARDVYYSGGAYYFATLGAAELCFRAAAQCGASAPRERQELANRGNAYLETVRAYAPESGELSEQFDQRTGAPASARDLAWSYAAFVSCRKARRDALSGAGGGAGGDATY